jgi:formylmethanofuran dehydrogenase subunit E
MLKEGTGMEKLFDELLASSARAHGHLCPGQVVGVRLAMLGCRLLGFDLPLSYEHQKKLVVLVEIDRCTGDAVAHVTGVRLGRRSLKFQDYGIMAATFVNIDQTWAFRVIATEEARDLAHLYAPGMIDRREKQIRAYQLMPEGVLFRVQKVRVDLSRYDLPGPTLHKATCVGCGQVVRDNREKIIDGNILCQPCAEGAYFKDPEEITWAGMSRSPAKDPGATISRSNSGAETGWSGVRVEERLG